MNQNRQPKGTTTGGQFAASANPESTVDLDAPASGADDVYAESRETIRQAQDDVDSILGRYHSREVIMSPDAIEAFDAMATIAEQQKRMVEDLESRLRQMEVIVADKNEELGQLYRASGGFRLNGVIRDNVRARIMDDVDDEFGAVSEETLAQVDELIDQHFDRFPPEDNNMLYDVTSAETDFFMERLDLEAMTLRRDL